MTARAGRVPDRAPAPDRSHDAAPPCGESGHGYALARVDAGTGFAAGDPLPPKDAASGAGPDGGLHVEVGAGPAHVPAGRPGVGLTGTRALRITVDDGGTAGAPRRRVLLDGLDVEVEAGTELRWAVCPVLDADLSYRSTAVAVAAQLDDGTWSDAHPLTDQHGAPVSADGQASARILLPDHWNLVRVALGALAGRRVRALAVTVAGAGPVEAWLDHVALGVRDEPVRRGLVGEVDTRRGSHASGAFSRGNTFPATSVPNGFVSWTPLTDGATDRWLYSWAGHNGPDNRPRLHGVAVSHQPSPWMGDRNQVAFHPVAGDREPDASLAARAAAFDHDDELARPHHYGVALDGGLRADVTPTDHGGVLRFAFPPGSTTGHVVVDAVSTEGAGPDGPLDLAVDPDGVLTGWVETGSGLSVGRSRMYVVGRFARAPRAVRPAAGDRPHARAATFDLGDDPVVELRVTTSFIGLDQAWHTFGLELADRTFAEVEEEARAAWEQRLAVLEVEGATEAQRATLYGGLYRLNLYPSSQWEDAGRPGAPEPWHASPVAAPAGPSTAERTGAAVLPGRVYVDHGFWDTYRTCWPAYALLHPEIAAELADGFVQQHREGGWVARWSSPGYADLMTGTSSDVAFADLHARGVGLRDPLGTYDAGLRNATALPAGPGVGRKGQAHALVHGYVPADVEESVSWHLEGCVNDAALAGMARRLAEDPGTPPARRRALADEAAYLAQRGGGYVHLLDPATGFFRARDRSGAFADPAGFDPRDWGGDYTESDAWNFAFHAPHDPAGLAAAHGGPDGLATVLDRFFATPERADRPGGYGQVIHEMVEARDVRLGQLGQSNQVSHHIPYVWLAAGRPDRTQEVVREVLDRLWTGSEIGQGYHGDEDNGEMSAWYLLSALGLYPLQAGTDRWAIGTPLFRRAVVHHPSGDLVVEAPDAGREAPYVHGLTVGGRPVTEPWVAHGDLLGGTTLRFTTGPEPSRWGAGWPGVTRVPTPWRDATAPADGGGPWRGAGGAVPGLSDDDLGSAVDLAAVLDGKGALTWSPGTVPPSPAAEASGFRAAESGAPLVAYTLTSAPDGATAPTAWRLEAREAASGTWRVLDERTGEEFPWPGQLRPFVLDTPAPLGEVRLVLVGPPGHLAQLELLVAPHP
ncbi:GH92 family glycosyl hydrolase [Cellulomonas sp. PS-H5]|uniref:GH92 family glycosyl hydrolase n=1 Tax=Cellulomonas sp. PS-H5 TaxID=2820400 RepID=UPI0027E255DE|nr:GH92 family glycosyl hydrolase [Cellulomonas sp. PS-H5]